MKKTSLLALLAIPLAGVGIVGSAALAAEATPTQITPLVATSVQSTAQEIQNGLPDGKEQNDNDREIPDAQEQQQLQSQAKITADQAKQAAEAKVSGKASGVQLEDEDGTVVYNVIVGNQEVKVNASDGSIVKIETEDGKHESAGERMTTGHGNEPNDGSSVSNGDGEVNDD